MLRLAALLSLLCLVPTVHAGGPLPPFESRAAFLDATRNGTIPLFLKSGGVWRESVYPSLVLVLKRDYGLEDDRCLESAKTDVVDQFVALSRYGLIAYGGEPLTKLLNAGQVMTSGTAAATQAYDERFREMVRVDCKYMPAEVVSRTALALKAMQKDYLLAMETYGPTHWQAQLATYEKDQEEQRTRLREQAAEAKRMAVDRVQAEQLASEQAAKEEKAERVAAAKRRAIRSTPEFKAKQAADNIRRHAAGKAYAEAALAKDDKVFAKSRAYDPQLRYTAGAAIVDAEHYIEEEWKVYKANGGTANSVEELLASPTK